MTYRLCCPIVPSTFGPYSFVDMQNREFQYLLVGSKEEILLAFKLCPLGSTLSHMYIEMESTLS